MNKITHDLEAKHTQVLQAILLSMGLLGSVGAAQATVTLTFTDNTSPLDPYPSVGTNSGTYTVPFLTGKEFRMIDPTNNPGGGIPTQKTVIDGGEQWVFTDDINLTSVLNTVTTDGSVTPGSAAPLGDVGLHQSATFFGSGFNFLAPTVGSLAGNAYGNGTINIDAANSAISVSFPVLEAQWAGTHFPLGQLDDGVHGTGISFSGAISNVASAGGTTTFDFIMTAEHIIQVGEDPGVAGFSSWTTQWEMHGSGSAPDALFFVPDSPTSNTGTLIPTPGGPGDGNLFNDGRITLAEAQSTPCGVEDPLVVTSACVGSCFDYTVTGIAFSPVQVVLPLTSAIPGNAVLRKCDGVAWANFDESGGDTIESAPGAAGDCSAPGVYQPGLIQGNYCVRTTIANGGANDLDGNALDTQIVDPVGVAAAAAAPGGGGLIPAESLGGGCTLRLSSGNAEHNAEWWLLGGFLAWLGLYRRKVAS